MLEEFNKHTSIIGLTLAVGAASGTAVTGITCTSFGRNMLKKIAHSSFDIYFAILGITTGFLVATVPTSLHKFAV